MSDLTTPQSGVRLSPDASVHLIPRPPLGGVWTTLPTESVADKIRAVNISNQPGRALEDVLGQDLEIEHLLLKGIQIANQETGELAECVLLLLVPHTGQPVQCVSWGVLQGIETIATMCGRPPWSPPITVRISPMRTKGKNRTYQVELVSIGGQQ